MSAVSMDSNYERQLPLRRALSIDGLVSGSLGVILTLAAGGLNDALGLSSEFLRVVGLTLLPYAALLIYLARQATISRRMTWVIVGANVMWAIDSFALLFTGWIDPTSMGTVLIAGQAAIVAMFADLQFYALRCPH